jgi:hypothetical protein
MLNIADPEDEEEDIEEKRNEKGEPQQRLIFPRDSEGYAILPTGESLSRKAQMTMIRDYCTINYRKWFILV